MKRSSLGVVAAGVLTVAGLGGCRSGQGPGPQAPVAPAPPGDVQQLVGQSRILRHRGHEKKLALKGDDLRKLAGGCDVAVEVRQAALDQGTLKLSLLHVGRPRMPGPRARDRRRPCVPARESTLTVSRVGNDAALRSALALVLPTPEEYLGGQGTPFDRAPAPPVPPIADASGTTNEERLAARPVTAWPVVLLTVDAGVPSLKRIGRRESEVDFVGVVGADGRLYDVRVTTPLSDDHVKQLQRAFSLWRYRPARAGERELPARITGRAVLAMY